MCNVVNKFFGLYKSFLGTKILTKIGENELCCCVVTVPCLSSDFGLSICLIVFPDSFECLC